MPRKTSAIRKRPKKRVYKPKTPGEVSHQCNWPGCPKMVTGQSWGCAPHFKCLPLDLRMKVHKAFGPPKAVYYPKVQAAIEQWVKNQSPGNYPGVKFYP